MIDNNPQNFWVIKPHFRTPYLGFSGLFISHKPPVIHFRPEVQGLGSNKVPGISCPKPVPRARFSMEEICKFISSFL